MDEMTGVSAIVILSLCNILKWSNDGWLPPAGAEVTSAANQKRDWGLDWPMRGH